MRNKNRCRKTVKTLKHTSSPFKRTSSGSIHTYSVRLILRKLSEYAAVLMIELLKFTVFDAAPHSCCHLVIEPQIVQHTEPHTEPFVSLQQVTYICAGVTFACGTTAVLRYRPGIKFVFFGEQPHFAAPSENISVLCIAQRQHTVKKIHPAPAESSAKG